MIGSIDWEILRAHAQRLATDHAGKPVAPSARGLSDLEVSGPAEITAMTRAAAAHNGSVLMSSGGTTGTPKLTYVPHEMALERLLRSWRPLQPGNVLLNLYNPGRMWGTHYYMQKLAEVSGCTVIPSGPYAPEELGTWLPMFRDVGVDALAATPTGLADFAEGVLKSGVELPVKTIIWMGDPWTESKRELVREAFPEAELWANYGSVETWVMATNRPGCDESTLHLLPDQIIEPDYAGALLTRAGEGWTVPVVRYRLGDRVEPARCRCGQGDALRILGRADDAFNLFGILFNVRELLDSARQFTGVVDAQLVLTRTADSPKAASALTLEFTGSADAHSVHHWLTSSFYRLATLDGQHPGAISAHRVDQLRRIDRTNKTPAAVWKDIPGRAA